MREEIETDNKRKHAHSQSSRGFGPRFASDTLRSLTGCTPSRTHRGEVRFLIASSIDKGSFMVMVILSICKVHWRTRR